MPTPVTGPTQPTAPATTPRPATPARRVPPEQNPLRWNVPDRACISTVMPVVSDADKRQYKIVADLVKSRIYVVDRQTNQPVDAYLTSPGTDRYPTRGNRFTITRVMPMSWWNPPNSDWAQGKHPAPPGTENPMGALKLNLGGYGEYIHGVPQGELRQLGRHASHGCLRMSNGNVIDLYRNYATVGTVVEINRSATQSRALASQFAASGQTLHGIHDGDEYIQPMVNACGPNQ